jgi:hypothetical protein
MSGALVASWLLPACSDSPLPGSQLGTYKVTGVPQSNTCGLGAPNPWAFNVQLSKNSGMLYWSFMDGSPLLSGPLSAQSQALIESAQQANVDGAPDGAPGACVMGRQDTISVTLGSGSPPAGFTGSLSYAFSVPSGYNCSDQLVAAGGTYDALPCAITYSITATHQ